MIYHRRCLSFLDASPETPAVVLYSAHGLEQLLAEEKLDLVSTPHSCWPDAKPGLWIATPGRMAKYNEALPDSLLEGAGFVYEPALKFWYVPAPSA